MPETDPILFELQRLRADVDELIRGEFNPYAVGTWTPAFSGSSTAGVYTYTIQQGYYIKSGQLVTIFGQVRISAIGTPPVGTMRISGLPFTCGATYYGHVTFGQINQFNYTAAALGLQGMVNITTTLILLRESFDNGALVEVPAANFTNAACDLFFSGIYLVD